jgi:cysteinyl-tRNA synthetase
MRYLGETFDIHCGGVDNIFPHHENEIAQSESATGKTFANYWLHNEHLLVEGKRMAKRFGNYYTLRDLLGKGYAPEAIRFLLLSTHYRQQFNFTFEGLEAAKSAVERLRNFVRRLREANGVESNGNVVDLVSRVEVGFGSAMNDDLNIGVAMAVLFDFVRDINALLDADKIKRQEAETVEKLITSIDDVLGVIGSITAEETLPKEAEELIREREEARKTKNWKKADEIRLQLKAIGIVVEDTNAGVRWRLEKKA